MRHDQSNTYKAWTNNDKYVEFIYNSHNLSFDCNLDEDYCEQLSQ